MVEIDTGVALEIKHSASGGYLEIRMPLAGEPSEVWRGLLTSLAEGQQVTLFDADDRSWSASSFTATPTMPGPSRSD